jgi:mediator of RNA polymerase II transcription subunit 14
MRNPDLLTALSLLGTGSYTRLPTSLTEPFEDRPPLSNAAVRQTLDRLNSLIRYRLRCLEYIPPELVVLEIADGRAYFKGGAGQWQAEVSWVNFDDWHARPRWWLTGVEWRWRERTSGVDAPGGSEGRRLSGPERQSVLDYANWNVLMPVEREDAAGDGAEAQRAVRGIENPGTPTASAVVKRAPESEGYSLVRLHNFLREYYYRIEEPS